MNTLNLGCAVALLATMAVSAVAEPVDIPLMEGVVVDGKAADWGAGGYRVDVLAPMGGPGARPPGQRVQARLGWDRRGLLLLVTVWDDRWVESHHADRLNEGDSIEAFLSAAGRGSCHWAISPGMDPSQPQPRWQLFGERVGEAVRRGAADPVVARTRDGDRCLVEILLPWSGPGIEPGEGREIAFQFWVADADGPGHDVQQVWKPRQAYRLARSASPPQRILYRVGFNARAMLASILVEGPAELVGKPARLADGTRTLAQTTFGAGESGYATTELLVPERAAGAPPYGPLTILADGQEVARTSAPDAGKRRAEEVLFSRMAARPASVFRGEAFPSVDFENPEGIARAIGPYTLKTTFYDETFKPVTRAPSPGRYGAVVEVAAADGRTCRRFVTLFRRPDGESWPSRADAGRLPAPEAPGAAAAWAELFRAGPSDRQWWVSFKREFYGWRARWPREFVCPRPLEGPPATVVREGTAAQAGMKPDAAARIDAVLTRWAADSDEPFSVCVVRHGVIVLHKAYGTERGRAMTVDDPRFMASLTKFFSSVLMLTFADQGLVDLEAPVAAYLPPFRGVRSNKPLTVRHLYTHLNGFEWHWGAWENDLEERLAFHLPNVVVGERFFYNSTGFDLGSKILEAVSGEALPDLAQRHLLGPLGCRGTTLPDGGASAWAVPLDMARIGQMLLNKGSYGSVRFMSERTFSLLLPPSGTGYGLGTMWMTEPGLGPRTFAHGAKSMSTLRIDPDHDLVIAMARTRPGANYIIHHPLFLAAVVAGLAP